MNISKAKDKCEAWVAMIALAFLFHHDCHFWHLSLLDFKTSQPRISSTYSWNKPWE